MEATVKMQESVTTQRVAKLKEDLMQQRLRHDTERVKFVLDVYKETGEDPVPIRRAKLFDRICSDTVIGQHMDNIQDTFRIFIHR